MILVNGEARSSVSVLDRGLAYGDGVFRTFTALSGEPMQWQRQYAKLSADAAALGIIAPRVELLTSEVKLACGHIPASAVKIILTRGEGARGYGYSGQEKITRVVFAESLPETFAERRARGVAVRLCSIRLGHQPALAGLKHLNRLENVLARAEWSDPGIAEGLLCDIEGNMICGTMTNIFVARGGALATPRLDRCGVAGVTRDRVLEAASKSGIPCSVATLSWDDVATADEVFLVNSLAGVWPVRELAGQPRAPGNITRELQRALERDDDTKVD